MFEENQVAGTLMLMVKAYLPVKHIKKLEDKKYNLAL